MKDHLLAALKRSLEEAGLWQKNALLLAAVSGGGDSMALLYGLTIFGTKAAFGWRRAMCSTAFGAKAPGWINA